MIYMRMAGQSGLEPGTACFVVDCQFTMLRFCMSSADLSA